jgi:hypothetical protein
MNKSKAIKLYSGIVAFYPYTFSKELKEQMVQTFADLYEDTLVGHEFAFWKNILTDATISLVGAYIREYKAYINSSLLMEDGKISIQQLVAPAVALLLILPALAFIALGSLMNIFLHGHALQGYYKSWIYSTHILYPILVILPLFAFAFSLLTIIVKVVRNHELFHSVSKFIIENIVLAVVCIVSIGIVFIVFEHDTVACYMHIFSGIKAVQYCIATH